MTKLLYIYLHIMKKNVITFRYGSHGRTNDTISEKMDLIDTFFAKI